MAFSNFLIDRLGISGSRAHVYAWLMRGATDLLAVRKAQKMVLMTTL